MCYKRESVVSHVRGQKSIECCESEQRVETEREIEWQIVADNVGDPRDEQ